MPGQFISNVFLVPKENGGIRKGNHMILHLSELNKSIVYRHFSLVYWGLTPQQQAGSYEGVEMMMMKSVFWWRKPEYPEETTDLRHIYRLFKMDSLHILKWIPYTQM